jgi:dienelactone hydrolase
VAVQGVKLGFVAIAPAVRGISTHRIPDFQGRHGDRECRSQVMHCLIAGRTALGERVWDMQRLLDWSLARPDVDSRRVLIMGKSGGGAVTMFAAACDERISVAVPSCSFGPTASAGGYLFRCDCNMVPGLMDLGGTPGIVGLAAPRHVLAVNGRKDPMFSAAEIDRAASPVRAIFAGANTSEHFQHRWGDEAQEFYQRLMWPFVLDAIPPGGTPRPR